MGVIGIFLIMLIALVIVLIMFPKLSKFFDKTVEHFDVEEKKIEKD